MSARKFNAFLKKIKTDIKKSGCNEFIAEQERDETIYISNLKSNRKHSCSIEEFKDYCEIGYFNANQNVLFVPFLNAEIEKMEFEGNLNLLFLEKRNYIGVEKALKSWMLISAVVALVIAILMKSLETTSTGYFSFGHTGNNLATHTLNWYHVLLLSVGLFVCYLVLKFTKIFKK